MSRNAGDLAILAIFMQIMLPEISLTCWRIWRFWRFLCKLCHPRYPWHVGEFGDFSDFYANYVTRDIPDMLANLANLAIFMQIMSPEIFLTCWRIWRIWRFYGNYVTRTIPDMLANLTILATFTQIMSPEISLTCWRIWRIWRFLWKLCHQRYPWHVGEFDDFGDFYANYVTRDIPDMLANLAILRLFMQITSPEMGLTCWRIWQFWRAEGWNTVFCSNGIKSNYFFVLK